MNVNVKVTLTDEERNVMANRLTGTLSKKMVSRADVNDFVKKQIERFLAVGSPTTETVEVEEIDHTEMSESDIKEVMKQNKLLLSRVNVLQHRLDTMK
jgi:hypothetical protein